MRQGWAISRLTSTPTLGFVWRSMVRALWSPCLECQDVRYRCQALRAGTYSPVPLYVSQYQTQEHESQCAKIYIGVALVSLNPPIYGSLCQCGGGDEREECGRVREKGFTPSRRFGCVSLTPGANERSRVCRARAQRARFHAATLYRDIETLQAYIAGSLGCRCPSKSHQPGRAVACLTSQCPTTLREPSQQAYGLSRSLTSLPRCLPSISIVRWPHRPRRSLSTVRILLGWNW